MNDITREQWYRNPEVLYNIIVASKNRETVFLSKSDKFMTVRNVMANYMDLLKKNFDAFNFFTRSYNLYYSLATYKKIQLFNFNVQKRKEQRESWNQSAIDNTASFDFGLDFDSDSLDTIDEAWQDAKKVKDFFDSYGVPYTVKFSGSKGFHITVPAHALPNLRITDDVDDEMSLFNYLKDLATMICLKFEAETIDLGIFDPRRIWKTDYSFVCESGLIALPLSDEQFNSFTLSMCDPLTVLKGGIRNRGDLMREGTREGLKRMVEEGLGAEWKELNSK